ncbi:MAG: tRNA uridine-5-carboxymethylaminomethyl(34) synthesis GTPase MnmE [Salinivirgaceae bacterium]|nr:tRNA uridine-5-carboxymethylaminomethyl(34) synthesis GTPase MnmE [Salinivirgaceae bacterium]
MHTSDTICAISTAAGSGAIALIRLSGEESVAIADKIFSSPRGIKLAEQKSHTAHFGYIVSNGETIDEVVATIFRAPHSFTGDDIVEFGCHGSQYIQQQILQAMMRNGARMAMPGEFTQRAFLNGKMDLSQAEAVADLIASNSQASHRVAMNQMRGGISNELQSLRAQLLNVVSLVELELDFSEEDVEFANRDQLEELMNNIATEIGKLLKSFSLGNSIKNGIPVAIVGEPNVGKSTLLNAILHEEKAIVSDIAGTTRDVIEDTFCLDGFTYRFIDTAGIRQTTNTIEQLGIERTFSKIGQAEIVLALFEPTDSEEKIAESLLNIKSHMASDANLVVVINKTDLGVPTIKTGETVVSISAKNGNLSVLLDTISNFAKQRQLSANDVIITNARHYNALLLAQESLERAQQNLRNNLTTDLLALDIHDVIKHLSGITGSEITPDEVLGNIFSHFCIGK